MYIVRPSEPDRFNGVVVVNWQNVTSGIDLGMPPQEIYEGYAWVGVSAQRVSIAGQPSIGKEFPATRGLPDADPERYGTLHHPGDQHSYDIFSQAARLLGPDRAPDGPDPLGDLVPRLVLASGGSQSAIRLGAYLNLAHQRDRVFDGFLLIGHWGMCSYPPDQTVMESFMPAGSGLTGGSSRIRDDSGTPILVLCSESEAPHMYPVRQPDTDTFRHWEMAGTAHAAGAALEAMAETMEGVELRANLGGILNNQIDWDYVSDASLRHLVRWVAHGEAPPRFPLIDIEADERGRAVFARDAWGNATGGMRLPEIEAATGRHRGTNAAGPAGALMGETIPFTAAELEGRYTDRAGYVAAYSTALDALMSAGLDVAPEADRLRRQAETTAEELFPT